MNQLETIQLLQEKFGDNPHFLSSLISAGVKKLNPFSAIKRTVGKSKKVKPDKPGKRREHKTINNYLMFRGLRSVRIKGMPTVAPKRSSGRFAIVNNSGRALYYIYPFAKIDDVNDQDIGFVLYDTQSKTYELYKKPLAQTNLPKQKGFMTMEGGISKVPHYVK